MSGSFLAVWLLGMAFTTVIGTYIVRRWRDTYGWGILVGILTAYLIVNTALAARSVTVPLPFSLPIVGASLTLLSGTLVWPFTSQIVDMINEVYGGTKSYVAAFLGYLGRVIFVIVATSAAQLTPVWAADKEAWWQSYFGSMPRIIVAGFISYAVVQFLNIFVFVKMKRKTLPTETTLWAKIKGGFLRSWGGDFFADLVDSPLFYILAFAGVMEQNVLIPLIVSATATKFIINQIDLPYYALFLVLLGDKVRKDY